MLPLKFICHTRKMRKDGCSPIYIQYCYTSTHRTLLNTKMAIPPKYWNRKKGCIQKELPEVFGEAAAMNNELLRQYRLVEDLIAQCEKMGVVEVGLFVKKHFHPQLDLATLSPLQKAKSQPLPPAPRKVPSTDVYAQLDDYIAAKAHRVSPASLTIFKNVKTHLQAFDHHRKERLTFDAFDYNFYDAFVRFLMFEYVQPRKKEKVVGLKTNTVGKTIRQLRVFLRDRMRRKLIPPVDLADFKILEEDCDAIYLSFGEIETLYRADLSSTPHLLPYQSLFVLACLTGLRFSDFSTLQAKDMRNGFLYKKQEKTDHWVVIPLRREAQAIFESFCLKALPRMSNPEFNRHIKTIGWLAGLREEISFYYKKGCKTIEMKKPKCALITSHTARRSFCTNEFLSGTPVKLIMKISGHKNEKDFYKYIRITPEEAAEKIRQLWQERGNMNAFNQTQ
jgi:integrase